MPANRRELLAQLGLWSLASSCAPAPTAAAAAAGPYLAYDRRLRDAVDPPSGSFLAPLAQQLLAQTNAFRSSVAVPALADDPTLALAARAHASDMAGRRFFAHASPEGFGPNDRVGLLVRGLAGAFGENIAYIDQGERLPSARQFVEGWRRSPGHRANMAKAEYTHAGHAAVRIGTKVIAAAVLATTATRFPDLPLAGDAREVAGALERAAPRTSGYLLSTPSGEPEDRRYLLGGPYPELAPGAWRVRPLLGRGGTRYDVLWGPIFVTE